MVLLGIKQFSDPYYQGFAAQISFYLMLSIVPIFLVLTQVLGIFGLSLEDAVSWFSKYTGKEVSGMLKNITDFSKAGFSNIAYIFIALWASSRVQFSIMRINNYTFTEGRNTGRGYWREQIRAIGTMTLTIFTVAFSLLILGNGDLILKGVVSAFGLDPSPYLDSIWRYARWVIGLVLFFFTISYNYYMMPSSKVPFRKILPGSIFAAVGMLLVTLIYAIYTNSLANYDILYGTLSSIAAMLFWFFFLAWVLCLGILVNKVWSDTKDYYKKKPSENFYC